MTTRVVHRPARTVRPLPVEEPLTMSAPPVLPEGKTATGMQSLIPLAGAGAAMSMMMFLRGSGFAALGAVIMVVSLGAAGIFYFTQRGQATRKRKAQRERYLDYLEELREQLRHHEEDFRERSARPDPPVSHLLDVVRDPARLWERRRADIDFLRVRIGTGSLPLREIQMREEGTLVNPTDPFMKAEAQAVIRRFSRTPDLPLRVGLDRAGDVSVIGAQRADVLALARVILAQVGALHAPDDVAVAVLTAPEREPDWAWTRWLPHLLDRERLGPAGPTPRLVTDPQSLAALLADDLAQRATNAAAALRFGSGRYGSGAEEARTRQRLLVIDDAHGQVARQLATPDAATGLPSLGVTVVHLLADRLHEPGEISRRVTVDGAAVTLEELTAMPPVTVRGTLDDAPGPLVEGLARQLAPLRLSADSYDDGTGTPPADFTALLGITDPSRLELDRLWRPRSERDFLRVPLGVDAVGRPTLLDLKESAQLGMGPHGLCVGATGSGKSELLRTLVLALVATHPPEQLSLVLVDYKGGATFAPFTELPHVAGLITNLAADASLVERMYTSLDGEVLRRQQLLADAGKLTDIGQYTLHRAQRPALPPLGYLLVIIDEFGELLTAKPEFVELFCGSAGSAGPSGCTCCCPASASSRASCAGWRPTCPTASGCARCRRWSPAPCWTPPMRSTFQRYPATATSRSTSPSTRSSRQPTSPARCATVPSPRRCRCTDRWSSPCHGSPGPPGRPPASRSPPGPPRGAPGRRCCPPWWSRSGRSGGGCRRSGCRRCRPR
ncbi:MAG: type VII secretion protein EccCa [Pseudonocardiaceae bacterium]